MAKNILYFLLLILFVISCGKDVVIIENPPPPIITDEIYEVNLVGFASDENQEYISQVKIRLDGNDFETDDSGLFYVSKSQIGKRGKVLQVEKDGYLTGFTRIAHHQGLEDINLNVNLLKAPPSVSIGVAGGKLESDAGDLQIGSSAINQTGDFVFRTFFGENTGLGNNDFLYFANEVNYLLKEATFYVDGTAMLNEKANLKIALDKEKFTSTDLSSLNLFVFDETDLQWKKKPFQYREENEIIEFEIDSYGWWTIADEVSAVYAQLNVLENDDQLVNSAAASIFFENSNYSGPELYTSLGGSISTYFPIDKSLSVSLNSGAYISEIISGFSVNDLEKNIEFEEDIQVQFEGLVYNCDFTFSDGYYAILTDGQHKVKKISNGLLSGETFTSTDDLVFNFYSEDFTYKSSKQIDLSYLTSNTQSFLSCSDLSDNLIVSNSSELIQDFEMCRVKVRPKETVVIGENSDDEVFLASFEGDGVGTFEGLIYFPLITDNDVQPEVEVNIVLYDESQNKVGGFIRTEYLSTDEELTISFIGNIE
ncbi:MAG: hypothetical protein P1U56_15265 [Saprospiraceae bacterium]|nr:hypothetical protein [Saprospiraceae bacterium]